MLTKNNLILYIFNNVIRKRTVPVDDTNEVLT